jgi:hypothetical protein
MSPSFHKHVQGASEVPAGTITDVRKDGQEIGEIVFVGNICARGYYKPELGDL